MIFYWYIIDPEQVFQHNARFENMYFDIDSKLIKRGTSAPQKSPYYISESVTPLSGGEYRHVLKASDGKFSQIINSDDSIDDLNRITGTIKHQLIHAFRLLMINMEKEYRKRQKEEEEGERAIRERISSQINLTTAPDDLIIGSSLRRKYRTKTRMNRVSKKVSHRLRKLKRKR